MAYIYKEDKGSNKDTQDSLRQMEKDVQEAREIEAELSRVWDKIKTDAFLDCPKDTWSLANTIRIVKSPMLSMTGDVSPIKSITIFDRSIVAGDLMRINPKTKGPVDYASLVHDGYVMQNGRVFNGRPFLTNALSKNDAELEKAIDRALTKLGKKFEGGS